MTTNKPMPKGQKMAMKILLWILAALIAFIVLIVIVVAVSGGKDDTTTTTAASSSSAEETAPADASSSAPMPWERHPACVPDDGTAAMVHGVLNDSTLQVANGQLIKDGNGTWIGVSLLRPDGEFESRSDVWLLRDGALYAVSGGARSASWAAAAPGVSMSDEYAAGVDRCVVAETMGR